MFLLFSSLSFISELKTEDICCSETSGSHKTTWHYYKEGRTLQIHRRYNLISGKYAVSFQ
jgi:hypothetical protein